MSGLSSFINRFNLVKQIPVFHKLNWFDLQRIVRKSVITEYKKGDLIVAEGSPPDYFYCLVSGRLQAYATVAGIKEDVDFIHRGVYFGVVSILTGENHSLTFEAINDSIILRISKNDFQGILKAIPQLGIILSQNLSQRMSKRNKGFKKIFESNIISVYSPVAGTGSSTYAIHLAINLQKETRKKVICVQIASKKRQDQSTQALAGPQWNIPAVELSDIVGDYEKIVESISKSDLDIDLLPVAFDPSDNNLKKQISIFVSALVGEYHYVVVDLPNDMDDAVLETLTQSDLVHLVTWDRRSDLEETRKVIDRLEMVHKEKFREEKIRVIIRGVHDQIYLSFEEINKVIDYHVYTMLPYVRESDLNGDARLKNVSFMNCADMSEYGKTLKRIAREIGGVMVGLVLGGGAALGVAHVGVIRVLEKENIPVDVVVGSSMGALVGALWCVGRNAHELEVVAREFEKKSAMLNLFDPVIPISGLVQGGKITKWLRKHLGSKTFYSLKIPLKIVAYDLIRREEIVITRGSLVEAVRKSVAIPGVLEPVREGEKVIIDGGVLNPLPTNVLAGLGIKKIIAVNVLQSPDDALQSFEIIKKRENELRDIQFSNNPVHYLSFRFSKMISKLFTPNIADIIVRTLQATEYVIAQQSSQLADIVIHPDLVGINWFELNQVDELIKRGEKATRDHLPEIKKLLEE